MRVCHHVGGFEVLRKCLAEAGGVCHHVGGFEV